MGYKSAARSFQFGLGYGQRAAEIARLQELREKEEARREERHKWQIEEHDKKKQFEIVKREVDTAKAMMDAGDERGAAKKITDLYNEKYPNGDEVRIIFKSDNPNDEKWNTDPNLKGKDIAILSKSGGVLPYKNMKDLMNYVATSLDYGQFKKDSDAVAAKVAEANNQSKPFQAHDGKWYVQQYKMGPGGSVVKAGDPILYSGKVPMTGGLGKAAESGLDISKLTTKDKEILTGMRERKKEPAPLKPEDRTKAAKVQSELFAKDLNIVLKPFKKPGRTVINMETGEITDEGQNALDAALNLWQKYRNSQLPPDEFYEEYKDKVWITQKERKRIAKMSPREFYNIYKHSVARLTPEEKKKLRYARDA